MAEDTDAGTDVDTKKLGLWLRLISNSHMVEKEVRNLFRSEYGVTLPRFDLMSALFREPGGLTMGELSRRLLVSNGNVTGIVERLQKEGLVKRWVLPTDRRIYSVGLTPKGRAEFKDMADSHRQWISGIFGDIEQDELDQMIHTMDRLREVLRERKAQNTEG
ncbi:MarR family winged helix-turn-helix transcriptional regulator [Paremcibacter congregatus]|uniref:MarR family transcriptional regulator n=1 Tax=Paremcibacter congregatus TaxID=2043170 RepID=A0A2G4YP15_9PROT|nr:MarR family transcriptional regulator [Paremcibacter congregatus]PHZ84050.1 MarR family transcriptional regulator [Paremcibacter congregatus]QDE25889.1 MarR family transcriptional regulator [Paremcibacter congregatus]|tara:strand:- start:16285 stop:16770 length:486 start_codon:yes stop_codon:yes gene_type:complete